MADANLEPVSDPAAGRSLPRPVRRTLGWGVHLLTASGAGVGALALLLASEGALAQAGLCMLAALWIDSIDGTLARGVGVAEVIPRIDGRRLDDVVDYLNFAVVPVAFMVWSGSLPSAAWVFLPLVASAYGFSQVNAKTDDDFFLGWPSYWNIVALYLWLLEVGPAAGAAWVALLSAAIFVPLRYVYPSKLRRFRRTSTLLGLLWGASLVFACLQPERARAWHVPELSLLYIGYYLGLSAWLGSWWKRPMPP